MGLMGRRNHYKMYPVQCPRCVPFRPFSDRVTLETFSVTLLLPLPLVRRDVIYECALKRLMSLWKSRTHSLCVTCFTLSFSCRYVDHRALALFGIGTSRRFFAHIFDVFSWYCGSSLSKIEKYVGKPKPRRSEKLVLNTFLGCSGLEHLNHLIYHKCAHTRTSHGQRFEARHIQATALSSSTIRHQVYKITVCCRSMR